MSTIARLLQTLRKAWRQLRRRIGAGRADADSDPGSVEAVQQARQQGRAAWMEMVRQRAPHLLAADEAQRGPKRRRLRWPRMRRGETAPPASDGNRPRVNTTTRPPPGDLAGRRRFDPPGDERSASSGTAQRPYPPEARSPGDHAGSVAWHPADTPAVDPSASNAPSDEAPTPSGNTAEAHEPAAVPQHQDRRRDGADSMDMRRDRGAERGGVDRFDADTPMGAGGGAASAPGAEARLSRSTAATSSWRRDGEPSAASASGSTPTERATVAEPAHAPPMTGRPWSGGDITPPGSGEADPWSSAAAVPASEPSHPWPAMATPAQAGGDRWPQPPEVPADTAMARWPSLLADPTPAPDRPPRTAWADGDRQDRLYAEQRGL